MTDTAATPQPQPEIYVAPAPHIYSGALTTRRMMLDVIIALAPVMAVAVWVFQWYAVRQVTICVVSCLAAETVFGMMRQKRISVGDFSAVVTGLILAFSIPAVTPWYAGVIGSVAAVGLGKMAFGGLGGNIFNPAMVGRAFAMMTFPAALGASIGGYIIPNASLDILTQATPMTVVKQTSEAAALLKLMIGNTNGSIGETSAIACLIGGLYLCIRRTASWEIPAGALAAVAAIAGIVSLAGGNPQWTVAHELFGGALMFGAFFIITDPVSSPLTHKGKFIFGLGFGALVMLLRKLSGYPEGVMFSVLLMNAIVPLINRWTIPTPVGGPAPVREQ